MTQSNSPSAQGLNFRPARPKDAAEICSLYVGAYTPEGGGDAAEAYPFPQLMDPVAVAEMISGGDFAWVVAEGPGGEVVASAAAVRNIGGRDDRIAEVFGVVVHQQFHRQGVGSTLLRRLVAQLEDSADFVLCEARTAGAGGWKVARNTGFLPVGFVPYAHAMPVGFESMVLTAKRGSTWDQSWAARGLEFAEGTTPAIRRLAGAVCGQPGRATVVAPARSDTPSRRELPPVAIEVHCADGAGGPFFAKPDDLLDRRSGVVGLRPLLGSDRSGRRTVHETCTVVAGLVPLGGARVVYDRIDSRARILGLRARAEADRYTVLTAVVNHVIDLAGDTPLVVLLWVRAGSIRLQDELDTLAFFPTAYLPGMIAGPHEREDVVQYTRLVGRSLRGSIKGVTALDWPEARAVIDQVLRDQGDV